jgi:hypothetical protein
MKGYFTMGTEINMAQSNAAMTLAEELHKVRQQTTYRALLMNRMAENVLDWQRRNAADFTEFSQRDLVLMVSRGILYSEIFLADEIKRKEKAEQQDSIRVLTEATSESLAATLNSLQGVIDDPIIGGRVKQQVSIDFQNLNHDMRQQGFTPIHDEATHTWSVGRKEQK